MGSSVKSYSKHASVTLKHPVKGDDPSTEIEEYFLEKRKWTLDDICCWDDAHEIARHTGRLENKTPIIYKAASRIENNLNEQCCILSSELRKARREKKKLEGENE